MQHTSARVTSQALAAFGRLRDAAGALRFGAPVAHVYNPLAYAWPMVEAYVRRWGSGRRRVLFVGMNPGPWGMAQTGVPFGEVAVVRDWLGLAAPIGAPPRCHPARPVLGLACARSEVSGRRLWGLFAARFGTPEAFFADHLVLNYCPLLLLDESGRNRTPDKLPAGERLALEAACDATLADLVAAYRPAWCIGVGAYAHGRLARAVGPEGPRVAGILHPSPASPAANRGWAAVVTRQLEDLGVW